MSPRGGFRKKGAARFPFLARCARRAGALPAMHKPEHRLALGAGASGELVALGDDERRRRLRLVGHTGAGESALLLNLLRQDFAAGASARFRSARDIAAPAVRGFDGAGGVGARLTTESSPIARWSDANRGPTQARQALLRRPGLLTSPGRRTIGPTALIRRISIH